MTKSLPSLPPNCLVQTRTCPTCRTTIVGVYRTFTSSEQLDEWIQSSGAEQIVLYPLRCPQCDGPETSDDQVMPTHMSAYQAGKPLGEPMALGDWHTAVSGHNTDAPYAVILPPDVAQAQEQAILDFEKWPTSAFDAFVEAYVQDTVAQHKLDDVWRRWTSAHWSDAFRAAGIAQPSRPSAYKAEARQHAATILTAHLRKAIADAQFLSLPIWAQGIATRLDAWTTQYLILHIPLPEALEGVRTELIGRVVPKSSFLDGATLMGRLRDAQAALDDQRAKSRRLLEQLSDQRRDIAERDRRLAVAYDRIRALEDQVARPSTEATVEPRDTAKHAAWKALVRDLRAEVARLERALERAQAQAPEWPAEPAVDAPTQQEGEEVSNLAGKTVLVVGGQWAQFPVGDYPCTVLHHDGHREEGLESVLNTADIVVIVTSHISHGTYWRVRDEAADRGIPLGLTTATNPARILNVASRVR